jgi:hypothetical protein
MSTVTKTRAALDELADLRAAAARLREAPADVERERKRLGAELEAKRLTLRDYYAEGVKDAARERRLREAVATAEESQRQPWDDRLEGARLAHDRACSEVDVFIEQNFVRLAEELAVVAMGARARLVEAFGAFIAAHERYVEVNAAWRPLLEQGPELPAATLPLPVRMGHSQRAERMRDALATLQSVFAAGVSPPMPYALMSGDDDAEAA